jgi:hypothetical protein
MIFYILRYLPFFHLFVNYLYGIAFCFGITFNSIGLLSDKYVNVFNNEWSMFFLFTVFVHFFIFSVLFGLRILLLHFKVKLTVKFDKKQKRTLVAQFIDLFRSNQDVDVEAHYAFKVFNFEKAVLLFENEISKNPMSQKVKILYILFLFEMKESTPETNLTVNTLTKELTKMKSSFILHDTKFLKQYCIQKRLEISLSQNMGEENGYVALEARKAKKATKNYFYCVHKFWKIVDEKKFRPYQISETISSMNYYEAKADSIYESLLMEYPSNISILRTFGQYIESVKSQHKKATSLYEYANNLEDIQSKIGFKSVQNDTMDRLKNRVKGIISKYEKKNESIEMKEVIEPKSISPRLSEESVLNSTPEMAHIPTISYSGIQLEDVNAFRDNLQNYKFETNSSNSDTDENYSNSIIDRMKIKRNSTASADSNENMKKEIPDEDEIEKLNQTEKIFYEFKKDEIKKEIPCPFILFTIAIILFFIVSISSISVGFFVTYSELSDIQGALTLFEKVQTCRRSSLLLSYYSRQAQVSSGKKNITQEIQEILRVANDLSDASMFIYKRTINKEKVATFWKDDQRLKVSRLIGGLNTSLLDGQLNLISKAKKMTDLGFFNFTDEQNRETFYYVNVNGAFSFPDTFNELSDKMEEEALQQNILLYVYCTICMVVFLFSAIVIVSILFLVYCIELSHQKLFYSIESSNIQTILKNYTRLSELDENADIERKRSYLPLCVKIPFSLLFIFILGASLLTIFMIIFGITQSTYTSNANEIDISARRTDELIELRMRVFEFQTNQSFFSFEENRNKVEKQISLFELYHSTLRHGNSDFGVKGSDGVINALDELYYYAPCNNDTNIDCMSLHEMVLDISKNVNGLLTSGGSILEIYALRIYLLIEKSLPLFEKVLISFV